MQAKNRGQAIKAAHQAVTVVTTNSNLINLPIRQGKLTPEIKAFRDAVNYAIQNAPDYGVPRRLDRVVDFSVAFLNQILKAQELTDAAFTATSSVPMDPEANRPFRNTLLHIEARWAADVADLSPDPHIKEHLLPSNARFKILRGQIRDRDGDLSDYSQPVKAELWLEQIEPDQGDVVRDPWKRR
ncbi:hypothetical protein SAMN07250955_108133 [Arboricoccus pini]|uniref:Uncharacterized protein n=2 Tax=Arboricoccus pini TaxID=1963835 RepID=A0A212RGP1_9PROT|nr:hypothetical protein SAMN07250955_108133 [Arboricoccus pini]